MLQVDTMPRERTFIMIKPDGVQRGLVAKIIARFEEKGFKLVAMKFSQPSKEHLETHYADLKEKKFFPGLISYMTSGPVVPMVRAISCAESVHAAAARRASRGGAAVRNGSQAAPSDSAAALFSGRRFEVHFGVPFEVQSQPCRRRSVLLCGNHVSP